MTPRTASKTRHARPARPFQAGFSVVELMVALVLGLVIVGGVINVFITNQQSFRTNENLGRMQENGRVAFELMAREVRQAGGNPCGTTLVANVLNNPTSSWTTDWAAGAVRGFNDNQVATGIVATGTAAGERAAGTDAILLLSSGLDDGVAIVSHDPAAAQFKVATINHGFNQFDIVLVCDNGSAAITQITNSSPGTNDTVVHNTGLGVPGNCTKGLGYPADCSSVLGTAKTFEGGGFISKLNSGFWYVGINPRGGRSLYRRSPVGSVEIAEGVTDMQLEYLLRNEATKVLDTNWVAASSITDWSLSAPAQVVAVRLRLTVTSAGNVGTDGQPLVRQMFHVISLRNRATS